MNETDEHIQQPEQDDEDEAEDEGTGITLGFLDDPEEQWEFESACFPSKAGGKPSWLSLNKLPPNELLTCPKCHVRMVFLLQVHAPLPNLRPSCFLRTIYLFCCRSCNVFQALRCQLADFNPFYVQDSIRVSHPAIKSTAPQSPLCDICGCFAPFKCSGCHIAQFCSEHHQKLAWNNYHSLECSTLSSTTTTTTERKNQYQGLLFPERLIITEEEPSKDPPNDPKTDEQIKRLIEQHTNNEKKTKRDENSSSTTTTTIDQQEEEEETTTNEMVDKEFLSFQKRMRRAPEQILRYFHNIGIDESDGEELIEPLWCNNEGKPNTETQIPKCQLCGKKRVAEFQITPQLIYLQNVSVDCNLDFGTLIIYSCCESCDISENSNCSYVPEFVWIQQPHSLPQ